MEMDASRSLPPGNRLANTDIGNTGESRGVSVVMVSYHTGFPLMDAVGAALDQPQTRELILVNNGNPPEAIGLLKTLAAKDKRLVLVSGHGNIGFAAGCNLGAALAKHDYLLLLNPDCLLPVGGLGRLLQEGTLAGQNWLIGGRLLNPDGTEQRGCRRETLTPKLALVEALRLHRLLPKHRFNFHTDSLPSSTVSVPVISGACMLMPSEHYRAVGGMDNGYFLHVEDIDFCVRVRQRGGEVLFCPHVPLLHHQGSSDGSALFVEWHKARSFIRYFNRHFIGNYPPGFLTLVSLGVLARYFLSIPVLASRLNKGTISSGTINRSVANSRAQVKRQFGDERPRRIA